MSTLADRLGIARRSATSVVDDLVARRLVERHPTPTDRRAVEVAVTPAGTRLLDQLRVRRHETAGELTAGLTPVELATLAGPPRPTDPAERHHGGAVTPLDDAISG